MTFDLHIGASPLLISMPHVGTDLPPAIERAYAESRPVVALIGRRIER